jgi:hypothetical protein
VTPKLVNDVAADTSTPPAPTTPPEKK